MNIKMTDINCFFFPFSSLKNISVTKAMQRFFALIKKKIIQFLYRSFRNSIGITDEWELRGVKKGLEYAILTNEITKAWSGLNTKEYKKFKNLKKENLRDNMTNLELVLNMLAEATTKEISKEKKPETFIENKIIAKQGGTIAGNTRKEIEEKTGKKVISSENAKELGTRNDNDIKSIEE
jgi:hypothetical protein